MRRPHVLDLVLLLLGLAMLVVSGWMARWTSEWAQAALLTVGAAVVLGVALRWVASAVREATARATTAADQATTAATTATQEASEAREHAEAAAASEERARETLETLDERVTEALDRANHPVRAAAAVARESRRPSDLREAILTARNEGALRRWDRPQVYVRGTEDFWVRVDATKPGVSLQLGREDGSLSRELIEMRDDNVAEALIGLGRLVQRHAPHLDPEPASVITDVAEILLLGASHEQRLGMVARVGSWGAGPGFIVSLDDAHDPPVRFGVKGAGSSDASVYADLGDHAASMLAREIAAKPDAWFR